MSFLAPLFLLGGLAIALPIVFHLLRRSVRKRVAFSSLMFLRPSPPQVRRRSRLEHWVLLLFRCLALILLALAFSRPFFPRSQESAGSASGKAVVLLLDTSASMRRDGLWEQVRGEVRKVLDSLRPEDHLALLTFDREVNTRLAWEAWRETPVQNRVAMALQSLDGVAPGYGATDLGVALVRASTYGQEMAHAMGVTGSTTGCEVVVVSDFQRGADLEGLQPYAWPENTVCRLRPVEAKGDSNAGLEWLPPSPLAVDAGATNGISVRVLNAETSDRDRFELTWRSAERSDNATSQVRREVYVAPGRMRRVSLRVPDGLTPRGTIELSGDDMPFDNTVYVASRQASEVPLIYLGDEEPTDPSAPLYYLKRAFEGIPAYAIQLHAESRMTHFSDDLLGQTRLLFVAKPLSSEGVGRVRSALKADKTVLFLLQEPGMTDGLARAVGVEDLTSREEVPSDYTLMGEMRFQHPLFKVFADPQYSDFTQIHFWRYRTVELEALGDAHVLARFDGGAPMLVEVNPSRGGTVLVLTSGWHPHDSQFGRSSKFVPWLYSLLRWSGSVEDMAASTTVGEAIPVRGIGGADSGTIRVGLPGGETQTLEAEEASFSGTERPGLYAFRRGSDVRWAAVNLAARESRTTPLAIDRLDRLGVPTDDGGLQAENVAVAEGSSRAVSAGELERRQALWRWLILGVLAVIGVEIWLGASVAQRPTEASEG